MLIEIKSFFHRSTTLSPDKLLLETLASTDEESVENTEDEFSSIFKCVSVDWLSSVEFCAAWWEGALEDDDDSSGKSNRESDARRGPGALDDDDEGPGALDDNDEGPGALDDEDEGPGALGDDNEGPGALDVDDEGLGALDDDDDDDEGPGVLEDNDACSSILVEASDVLLFSRFSVDWWTGEMLNIDESAVDVVSS